MKLGHNFVLKKFDELTTYELYDILALRTDIFVVEQTCPYPEVDYKDIGSLHLFIRESDLETANCAFAEGTLCGQASNGTAACSFTENEGTNCADISTPCNPVHFCENADTCVSRSCNKIVAYLRILPRGFSYPEVSIGRVSVREEFRGGGLARRMLNVAIQYIADELGETEIQIGAQEYLLEFYKSLGFEPVSAVYLEDGIPHLDMLRRG